MERGNRFLRFFDQFLGPLLVALVAGLRHRPDRPRSPRNIALIKAAALGDTVLVSALVTDLKSSFPEARIILFVGGSNIALARRIRGVDQVHRMPLKNLWSCFRILRQEKMDLVIDTDSWPRISALWAGLVKGAYAVGFQTAGQYRHYAYDLPVKHRGDQHELENYRDLLRSLCLEVGAPPQNFAKAVELRETTEIYRQYRSIRDSRSQLIYGLHLWPGGTQSHLKEWPVEFWQEVMQKSPDDVVFVLTGGPTDRERNEAVLASLDPALNARAFNAAGCSLDESLLILSEIFLLISVNTGVLHLAAAVDCPVVGLHGPTNPHRWGPVGAGHISLLARHELAGSLNLGFEYPDPEFNVMSFIAVEDVLKAAAEIRKREP